MIVVTGATGYIAWHLIPKLLEAGFRVFPLGRDISVLDKIETPEIVIHLAGKIQISLKQNPENPSYPPIIDQEDFWELYESNVNYTSKILRYCCKNKVKHLIFASSQTVYGMPEGDTLSEESRCIPLDYYGLTKLFAEKLLSIGEIENLPVTILRISGVYGGIRKNGIVRKFCEDAIKDKRIEIKIDYPLPFDIIHIDDVVDAIKKCTQYLPQNIKTRIFNISTGEFCNLNLLAQSVCEVVSDCQIISSGISQPVMRVDSNKARKQFDWLPVSRNERLTELCQHIRNQI